jgi:hypothetical protein
VVVLEDARDEVYEEGKEEKDDEAGCEEGVVPLVLWVIKRRARR